MIILMQATSFDIGMLFIGGMMCGMIVSTSIMYCGGRKNHGEKQQREELNAQERDETLDK